MSKNKVLEKLKAIEALVNDMSSSDLADLYNKSMEPALNDTKNQFDKLVELLKKDK